MGTHGTGLTIYRTKNAGGTMTLAEAGIDKTGAAYIAPTRKCPANDDVFVAGTLPDLRAMTSSAPRCRHGRLRLRPASSPCPDSTNWTTLVHSDDRVSRRGSLVRHVRLWDRGGDLRLTRNGGARGPISTHRRHCRLDRSTAWRSTQQIRIGRSWSCRAIDDVTPTRPGTYLRTDNALGPAPCGPAWVRPTWPTRTCRSMRSRSTQKHAAVYAAATWVSGRVRTRAPRGRRLGWSRSASGVRVRHSDQSDHQPHGHLHVRREPCADAGEFPPQHCAPPGSPRRASGSLRDGVATRSRREGPCVRAEARNGLRLSGCRPSRWS
jgi:hypothetical protein